jgi:hypothetical protein
MGVGMGRWIAWHFETVTRPDDQSKRQNEKTGSIFDTFLDTFLNKNHVSEASACAFAIRNNPSLCRHADVC